MKNINTTHPAKAKILRRFVLNRVQVAIYREMMWIIAKHELKPKAMHTFKEIKKRRIRGF